MSGDWTVGLGDGLAKNTSFKALTLTINNYNCISCLEVGLAKHTSLKAITLTIDNYSVMIGGWIEGLGRGLAKYTSLNALTLTINNYSHIRLQ